MFDKAKADHAVNFINCLKHTKLKSGAGWISLDYVKRV